MFSTGFTKSYWPLVTVLGVMLIFFAAENSLSQETDEWKGKLKDGTIITRVDLIRILKEHEKWFQSDGREGKRAELSDAYLVDVELDSAFLLGARLNRANLSAANLNLANLRDAEMNNAILRMAKLNRANLQIAKLNGADLFGAKLKGAEMWKCELDSAHPTYAELDSAILFGAKLKGAYLIQTKLNSADLAEAELNGAILQGADLDNAILKSTKLNGADLQGVDFSFAVFEPDPQSIVSGRAFAGARNLSKMTFQVTPDAMGALREAFRKAGMRQQEREVTYAIKHTERLRAWHEGLDDKVESIFNFIFFETTCGYGMYPLRPLRLLASLILFFTIPYIIALKTHGPAGIRVTWRKREFLVQSRPSRVWLRLHRKWRWLPIKWLRDLRVAFYFSLLSAFHIGWRELNVGNWITRMQFRNYTLHATGWVRFVSGLQSLISVYLLALWVLTYFGRPFE